MVRRGLLSSVVTSLWLLTVVFPIVLSFQPRGRINFRKQDVSLQLGPFGSFGSSSSSTIPTSPGDRDKQAINSVKAAIDKPITASFPLIECEFPPLSSLNKQGDGSLRSATQVDDANLEFCSKLVRSLAPIPLVGPKIRLLISSASSQNFTSKASKIVRGATSVTSLKNGIPSEIGAGDICVLVSPTNRNDYQIASSIASQTKAKAVILVNGLAKDQKSVPSTATMAYYLKPLTYNSQVVGYLVRNYPQKWATIDLFSKEVLGSFTDKEILVGDTNTPDLRESGKLVQKSVDLRAIRSRKN